MPLRKYSEILPIIFNTILVLSALYAPQPLLPVLSHEFAVSREAAAALTTVTFIPLALAPLAYGYLLETVSPIRVLKIAVPVLALSELFFAGSSSFSLLITTFGPGAVSGNMPGSRSVPVLRTCPDWPCPDARFRGAHTT